MKKQVGIGFRRDIADLLIDSQELQPAFIELAPENWMQMGGYWGKRLKKAIAKFPVTSHGLSLSLGSPDPLDKEFVHELRAFLNEHQVKIFSEHLSYTKTNNAHLFDLLPIPFRHDAVEHVSDRIKEAQDLLGRPIAIENVSYYTPVAAQMSEAEFISSVVEKSECQLLLDVNNVYVNAFNHNYDAYEFISEMPLNKVAYIHMAGHEQVEPDLIIDTHGQKIIDPVYELFEYTIQKMDPVPVLLERDFNLDNINELKQELEQLENICQKTWKQKLYAA